jgi:hypothetical protein
VVQSAAVSSLRSELAALDDAPLADLMQRYPALWAEVGAGLVAAAKGGPPALEAFARKAKATEGPWRERVRRSHGDPQVLAQALPALVAARMARLSLEQTLLAAATGQSSGEVRLGLWSGLVVQRLFFARALVRKPVSLRAFRLLWPLVTRKRALMPLVQQKGIYCFYSEALIAALTSLLAGRPALEVAAGDGTLSRFLNAAGAQVQASDDQSWKHVVAYPAAVERLGAVEAVQRRSPRAVLCSFPPPGNEFERRILAAPSVELYLVLTTRHRFAAGDWAAYEEQQAFDWRIDEGLSRLLLPPEIDPAVLVFERKER